MNALESYLAELRDIRASGGAAPETSGYGALATLLNDIGHHLKPRVRCFINLSDTGAGIPDGGLFVANQLQKGADPLPGQVPQRGAIEVKPPNANAREVARGEQVAKYLEKYRQVLVTSYREFVLVGYDAEGKATSLESYSLASSEAEFWALAAQPRKAATTHGERLTEFLERAMLRQAQIAAPQELAWFLASYAREARARVEEGGELPALITTRQALEQALGMTFESERGEHFFRSTLVQTLFYGLFAAWVFWAEQHLPTDTQARFRWREAAWYLHIPILSKLYGDFASPSQLGTMHLEEVLDWAGEALNRVDRASFFATFEQQHAVQYFYEPFLEAFDPELRKQLGVWYTPPEIVKYMVARVDQVLRSELDIADGLADPRVVVLDPCCGTGAYLVEVLNKIAETLQEKGGDALIANDLKKAAMSRVFGFEILPAPFVISHLQIGLALDRFGAPLAEDGKERAGVFLTNALTGWEPPIEPKQHLLFPELEMERDAATDVKQKKPILVILGNPPYNAFAGVSPEEEKDLVEPFKEGLVTEWGIRKFNLDELYVRFFGAAKKRIAEMSGRGVVSFISNSSWVSEVSFVVLRQTLLVDFDVFWIENMHGDRRITEYAPDGKSSQTVFAIPGFSPGIRQGTAISLWIKGTKNPRQDRVLYRDDLDDASAVVRRADLVESVTDPARESHYLVARPCKENKYSFRPEAIEAEYRRWPLLSELCLQRPVNGPIERRANSMVVIPDKVDSMLRALRAYVDPVMSDAEVAAIEPRFMHSSGEFVAAKTRMDLAGRVAISDENVARYPFKPFDTRLAYLDAALQPLFSRPSPTLLALKRSGGFVISRDRADDWPEGIPLLFSRTVCDYHVLSGEAKHIPQRVLARKQVGGGAQGSLLVGEDDAELEAMVRNLSRQAQAYLSSLELDAEHDHSESLDPLWAHVLAIGFSRRYLFANADGIRENYPRIPLPATANALLASAGFGCKVAALLDIESPVEMVTAGTVRHELRPIGPIAKADGGQIDPGAGDLAVTAGWGHAGQGGVTMPAKGRLVERAYSDDELAAFREGLGALDLNYEQLMACLGGTCLDVYLNDFAYWRCVPKPVWTYTIGGYQVMKKWLSYRERPLLGRDLTVTEARYVTEMARRIAAILLLEPALDANYERVKADTYPWLGTP